MKNLDIEKNGMKSLGMGKIEMKNLDMEKNGMKNLYVGKIGMKNLDMEKKLEGKILECEKFEWW